MERKWKYGKRGAGTGEQPHCKPHPTVLGCTKEATTALNTVTMGTDIGFEDEIKLLIDTGAELCLLKHKSIRDGTAYNPHLALNVRGISEGTERTLGEINVKLTTGNFETEHKFQVTGDGVNIPCDGILGKDFFEAKQATIDYARKEIVMRNVRLKFDDVQQTKAGVRKYESP